MIFDRDLGTKCLVTNYCKTDDLDLVLRQTSQTMAKISFFGQIWLLNSKMVGLKVLTTGHILVERSCVMP